MSTEETDAEDVFKKILEKYIHVPAELRAKMETRMCEFERANVLEITNSLETKSDVPKKIVYELQLSIEDSNDIRIFVQFLKEKQEDATDGYCLDFFIKNENKSMFFYPSPKLPMWQIQLETSTDLLELAEEYLQILAKHYQNEIKQLRLESKVEAKVNYGITSLNRLDSLGVFKKSDASEIIPLLRGPLKWLFLEEIEEVKPFEGLICEVPKELDLIKIHLTKQLFLKLSAEKEKVYLDVDELRKHDAAKLMKWLYGSTENEKKFTFFDFDGVVFDPQQIGRVFDKNWEEYLKTTEKDVGTDEDCKLVTVAGFKNETLHVTFFNDTIVKQNDGQIKLQDSNC